MQWDTTKKLQTDIMLKSEPTTEEIYFEQLGCLPPQAMVSNAFLVGEPFDHDKDLSGIFGARYDLYFIHKKKYYYGGLVSEGDFKTFLIKIN